MPKTYSMDLRQRALESYQESGHTQEEISELFGIHLSTFKRIYRRYRQTGSVALGKSQAGRPVLVSQSGRELIKSYVEKEPAITLSLASICRILKALNLNRKQISHYAQEQARQDVKKKR